ncbi:MAG: hypothetical protein LH467_06535 [Gemmatimonadaceae bacterium]|nr:hypothetical protein [Gemmatimonadaceae bacterium]
MLIPARLRHVAFTLAVMSPSMVHAQGTQALAWERHDSLRVVLSATAVRRGADTITIDYRLSNSPQSAQPVEFLVVRQNVRAYDFLGPVAWLPDARDVADSMAMSWTALERLVAPGQSADEFRQFAVGLLTIAPYRVRGASPTPQAILDADEDSLPRQPTVWENSVAGYTLGVDPLPATSSPAALGGRLRDLVSRSCRLGWIDPPGVCKSLLAKLDAANRSIAAGNIQAARGELEALGREVEAQRDKHLSSEAASLLTVNLAALLARLPTS